MPVEPIQKPNIGTPEYARKRQGRKFMALLTTVAFAVFWVYALWVVHAIFTDRPVEAVPAIMCVLGLGLGLWGRRQVEKE